MASILVVDDEPSIQAFVRALLERQGHDVATVSSGEEATAQLAEIPFDVVVSDVVMEPMDGLALLKHVRSHHPSTEVILISGFCEVQDAATLFKEGAFDYLPKPVKVEDLRDTVSCALDYRRRATGGRAHSFRKSYKFTAGGLLAENPEMVHLGEMLQRMAPTDMAVLIRGEPGSGRDTVARAIHRLSPRAEQAFVLFEAGQGSTKEQEALLFGPEGGAVARARGGTLYLKEVDGMPLELQDRLLEALDLPETRLRVVASTAKDLAQQAGSGDFHPRLFARLNLVPITLPPLRDRVEEILPLAHTYLKELTGDQELMPEVEQEAVVLLEHYAWPGNCTELHEVMAAVAPRLTDNLLRAEYLPEALHREVDVAGIMQAQRRELDQLRGRSLKTFLRERQKEVLKGMAGHDEKPEQAGDAPHDTAP